MSTLSSFIKKVRRRKRLLYGFKPFSHIALEIGPLYRPVLKKRKGRVFYVDIATKEALIEQYRNDINIKAVNLEKICNIDFVWDDRHGPLRDIIPTSLVFDYVVACNVIEHTSDMVGWLKQIAAVMKPGAILSLAAPDKRFTFDHEREIRPLERILKDHLEGVPEDRGAFRGHVQVFTFEAFASITGTLCADGIIPFHLLSLYRHSNSALEFIAILQRQ